MYCNVTNVTCNVKWIDSCSQFTGWYDAPFPFGKTDFTVVIESCQQGQFSGAGQDKQGDFTIKAQWAIRGSYVSLNNL